MKRLYMDVYQNVDRKLYSDLMDVGLGVITGHVYHKVSIGVVISTELLLHPVMREIDDEWER